MAANIVTVEDLQDFKQELIAEMHKILSKRQTTPVRKWLKSYEVRRLLTLSQGTLDHLRTSGKLPFTKIGRVIFYDYEDILKMIEQNKTNRDFPSRKNNPWRNV
jgi:hypothetical protein